MPLRPLRRLRSWSPLDLAFATVAITLTAASGGRFASALEPGVSRVPELERRAPVASLAPQEVFEPTRLEDLAATVSLAPFSPDRSPPRVRYRPDLAERGSTPSTPTPSRSRVPTLLLTGTAIQGATRLALIEGDAARPGTRLYRPGEELAGFTLKSVAADSALLESPDTTIVLRIVRPWKQ